MASEFPPPLFNKYFPPALLLLLHFPTLAAPAIFAPFPAIWWHFSLHPILPPVQKFNAVKSALFALLWPVVVTCCNSRISSISSRVVYQYFAAPKHTGPQILFILSPKSGPRSDFLPNVVSFGLFLLSAIAYSKIAFYLCTSNTSSGSLTAPDL